MVGIQCSFTLVYIFAHVTIFCTANALRVVDQLKVNLNSSRGHKMPRSAQYYGVSQN